MGLIEYLFFRPGPAGPVFDRWGGVLFGAYCGIALSILVFYSVLRVFSVRHSLRSRIAQRILSYGLLLEAICAVVLGLRFANIPVLSIRLWLYASIGAQVVAVGYLWWWLRNRYPDLLTQYEWEDRKRAYLPRAAGGAVAPTRRRAAARRV
jgi:hypothetical protein